MKKLFAMVLAIAMIATMMVMPVMAAETYTLTINNETTGHTYEAYQIFAGDLAVGDNGTTVLSNVNWGSAIPTDPATQAALLAEISALLNTSCTTAEDVAKRLGSHVTSDSATIDAFADIFSQKDEETGYFKYLTKTAGTSTYDQDKKNYTITGLDAGYYLVKDKDDTLELEYDAYTKYILRVLKNETVTPKSDIPTVEKTINDSLNGTYTEHEDFDITDTAYYKWVGSLPSNLSAYDSYYYKFTDTLPVGMNSNVTVNGETYAIQQIYIEGHDGNVVHTFYDVTDSDTENDVLPVGITVTYTDGVYERNTDGKVTATTTAEQIVVEFNDLKTLYSSLLPTHKIVVKYTAMVTRDAIIAYPGSLTGMVNKVDLTYSNEPNGDGLGKTLPDEAYAFTFRIVVDKYDANDSTKKLEGAEFVLYYERVENNETVKYYALVVTEEMIEAGTEINGKAVTQANLGNVWGFTTDPTEASVLDTDKNGSLTVGGLDEGVYYLEETKAPSGYDLMETPVQVVIKPSYKADGTLNAITYEVDSIAQNSDTVGIRNDAGTSLPVTGGVGTTMFYIFGGIMVVGALVLLISKKRMVA